MPEQTKYFLRPATEADEKTIQQMVRRQHINPTGLKWPRFVVAVDPTGKVVACGQNKTHSDGSTELASLVVREDHRGEGLARMIVEHLIDQHPGNLYLMCRPELEPLYVKFGFHAVPDEDLPRYFTRLKKIMKIPKLLFNMEPLIMLREKPGAANPA